MSKSAEQKIYQLVSVARLFDVEVREVFLGKKDYTELMGNYYQNKKIKEVPHKPGVVKVSLREWQE